MPEARYLKISCPEAGMKLLRFLERKLTLPPSLLLKWIRTGQVRVDKKRASPYDLLTAGQLVRIPPHQPQNTSILQLASSQEASTIDIIFESDELLVLNKPAGLAAHAGSGQSRHLAGIIAAMRPEPFPASAAHRLDRGTSGLVLAAKSMRLLKELQSLFKQNLIDKSYLTWVSGLWPHNETIMLEDNLLKQRSPSSKMERMVAVAEGLGRPAVTKVRLLTYRPDLSASLLEAHPVSGRTHQIRAQLSLRGFPIIGDLKYQGRPPYTRLMLHAWRITLPDGRGFKVLPGWLAPWAIADLSLELE